MSDDINTIGKLRAAIRRARRVFAVPKFGNYDIPVRISKADALAIVRGAKRSETPEEWDIGGGRFAFWWQGVEGGDLFIG